MSTGGVEHRSHPDAVVSLLSLEDKFDPDVLTSFCHYIHFFTTPQNGEKWAAQHDNVFVVRLDDAFELGRRFVAPILDGGGLKAE